MDVVGNLLAAGGKDGFSAVFSMHQVLGGRIEPEVSVHARIKHEFFVFQCAVSYL